VEPIEVGVSELVALVNQTFAYAYPSVTVVGELANLRVSKGRWVYFDLKDDGASVKFFATVYMLPGPLEDGMLVRVSASPRLHNLYGFSMNVQSIQPAGEGSIKKAAALLEAKLVAEGLFNADRKRLLPYPPKRIGLITSRQSAAYADFIKIIDARWGGMVIDVIDVQVQGEPAPRQIVAAIEQFNAMAEPPEVLVLIRGGGSPEDLAAFSTEQVTRAVAASRVTTLVAIGHEIDSSLAELAADQRASTPSNAAELLVPDRQTELRTLRDTKQYLNRLLTQQVTDRQRRLQEFAQQLHYYGQIRLHDAQKQLAMQQQLLAAYNPSAALERGYAIVRVDGIPVTTARALQTEQLATLELKDGIREVIVQGGSIKT
jgi:exodeoxyribonuclease VII large subunit